MGMPAGSGCTFMTFVNALNSSWENPAKSGMTLLAGFQWFIGILLRRSGLALLYRLVRMKGFDPFMGRLVCRIDPQRKLVLRQRLDHRAFFRIQICSTNIFLNRLGLVVQFLIGVADTDADDRVGIDNDTVFPSRQMTDFQSAFPNISGCIHELGFSLRRRRFLATSLLRSRLLRFRLQALPEPHASSGLRRPLAAEPSRSPCSDAFCVD